MSRSPDMSIAARRAGQSLRREAVWLLHREPALGIERRHAAHAGCCHRLAITLPETSPAANTPGTDVRVEPERTTSIVKVTLP
jgi:hypothetical protein